MCTVSIIPFPPLHGRGIGGAGFRVVTNRDERRDRPEATPPSWLRLPGEGDRRAIYPLDPEGGGTWVGASDRGLVLCLLNANPVPYPALPPADELTTRGLIIPRLIGSPDSPAVMAALEGMSVRRFAPFWLLAADLCEDEVRVIRAYWDRESLRIDEIPRGPVCAASSGLGDACVQSRLPLFDRLVAPEPTAEAQDAFHRHVWPDRTEVSVMMSRGDARTVSVTTVEVIRSGSGAPAVSMRYSPVADARAAVGRTRAAACAARVVG